MHAVSSGGPSSNRAYASTRGGGGGGGGGAGGGSSVRGEKGAGRDGAKKQVYRIGKTKITLDGKDGKTLDDIIEVRRDPDNQTSTLP